MIITRLKMAHLAIPILLPSPCVQSRPSHHHMRPVPWPRSFNSSMGESALTPWSQHASNYCVDPALTLILR